MGGIDSGEIAVLYQSLKKYSAEVRNDRRLPVPPAHSVTVYSAQCGSRLTLDARIDAGRIREIGYQVRACSLGQATTAIIARRAIGLDAAALRRVGGQLQSILDGRATRCDWPELEVFALIRDVPSRHGSAMLPFEALEQLFDRAGMSPSESAGMPTPRAAIPGGNEL